MENTCQVRVIITNEFGQQTDVAVGMPDSTIDSVYNAVRKSLLGHEYYPETVEKCFPRIEE